MKATSGAGHACCRTGGVRVEAARACRARRRTRPTVRAPGANAALDGVFSRKSPGAACTALRCGRVIIHEGSVRAVQAFVFQWHRRVRSHRARSALLVVARILARAATRALRSRRVAQFAEGAEYARAGLGVEDCVRTVVLDVFACWAELARSGTGAAVLALGAYGARVDGSFAVRPRIFPGGAVDAGPEGGGGLGVVEPGSVRAPPRRDWRWQERRRGWSRCVEPLCGESKEKEPRDNRIGDHFVRAQRVVTIECSPRCQISTAASGASEEVTRPKEHLRISPRLLTRRCTVQAAPDDPGGAAGAGSSCQKKSQTGRRC